MHEPSWYGPEDPGCDYEMRRTEAEFNELRPITEEEETRMHSDLDLWKKIRECYGDDVIIVHRTHPTEYFITSSSNIPARTKEILHELVERMS